jgi:hypothetical protein
MKSLKTKIQESLNDIELRYFLINGGWNSELFKSVSAAKRRINSIGRNKIEYYEITGFSDSSDANNLIEWDGTGGYFSNALEDTPWGEPLKQSEKDKILKKKYKN